MLSVTGMPYDTLRGVIGITGDGNGSLKEFGINYEQLDLLPDGTPDYDGMETAITPKHRMVYIQRSRGYSLRPSLTVEEIERIVKIAKRRAPDCIVMVDNCYGEYVQKMEPTGCGLQILWRVRSSKIRAAALRRTGAGALRAAATLLKAARIA